MNHGRRAAQAAARQPGPDRRADRAGGARRGDRSPTRPTTGCRSCPSYTLHVQVRNASELTHGAEVHMGGALVGHVTTVDPARDAAGQPIARARRSSSTRASSRCRSTRRSTIRLKGAIGLKYLAIDLGHSTQTYANGATVPVSQTSAEVDLDQVLSMFTPPTRKGVAETTIGFSDALAGARRRHQRRDRGVRAAGRRPAAGGAQPRLPEDRPRRVLPRARGVRRRARAGGEHAGRPVHQPRHHLPRARAGGDPVPAGLDLRRRRRHSAR